MAAEVLDIDYAAGQLGRKRNGSVLITGHGLTNSVKAMARYVAAEDESQAILAAADSNGDVRSKKIGGAWGARALADAPKGGVYVYTDFIVFNGRLFHAYQNTNGGNAINRLHFFDSAMVHHRVGLGVALAAPTTALAAGAVTDVRRYKVAFTVQSTGTVVATINRSELSPATANVTLTAQQCTVTRPTEPDGRATHWELYVASDDDTYTTYYLSATTVIATTTAVDNSANLTGAQPPPAGTNVCPPSCRYLATIGSQLIMAGSPETGLDANSGTAGQTTPQVNRVWWTSALGASDIGDDERISNTTVIKNFIDFEDPITAIGGPINGILLVFSMRRTWKLVPTEQAGAAFARIPLSRTVGCVEHKSIAVGEDERGLPALYWWSDAGPYRFGAGGLQYIGRDVEDLAPNYGATLIACSVWVPARKQVWMWIALTGNFPNLRLCYDTRLGRLTTVNGRTQMHYGWARHTLTSAQIGSVASACLFSGVFDGGDANATNIALVPYFGGTLNSAAVLFRGDRTNTDNGGGVASTLTTRAIQNPEGHKMSILEDGYIEGQSTAGATLQATVNRDFGTETLANATPVLVAQATHQRVKCEGLRVGNAHTIQFKLGDNAAGGADVDWLIDRFVVPIHVDERS